MSTTIQSTTQSSTEVVSSQPSWQDIETALVEVVKAGISHHYPKDSQLLQEYKKYVKEIRNASDKEEHIQRIAHMIFPDEESYTRRMSRYRRWYKNKRRLLQAIEKLYGYYYELSKENIPPETQVDEEAEDFLNSED